MISNIFSVADRKSRGFTLIEILMVMVLVSMLIVMGTQYFQQQAFNKRIERTTIQLQQILNAALGYYVSNGAWPTDITTLQTNNYLPPGNLTSPWGTPYKLAAGPSTKGAVSNIVPMVYVWLDVQAGTATTSTATIIAGSLPLAYTTTDTDSPPVTSAACDPAATTCTVVATANVPGQNLNNASAVNYAGIYHNGACVPVPQCPIDPITGQAMTPQIMVAPVSVSGVNADPSTGTNNGQVYPLNSFTAYATPYADYKGTSATGPAQCDSAKLANASNSNKNCYLNKQGLQQVDNGKYWRVCLQVVTSAGEVAWGNDTSNNNWGQYATVLAITRCSINNEYQNKSSGFNVWAP